MRLTNYLDALIDKNANSITQSPICLGGASRLLEKTYQNLKEHYRGTQFQRLLKNKGLFGIYHWKGNYHPIPIVKLKQLLSLWQEVCHRTRDERIALFDKFFDEGTHLKAGKSPNAIRLVKHLDADLAYLLGVLFADGSLRDIWLTKRNKGRFVYEITITDESFDNVHSIQLLIEKIFGLKTSVRSAYNGRWYRLLFSSLPLFKLLNIVFDMPMGYKKGRLRIPTVLRGAPLRLRKSFLSGFFDGDGYCSLPGAKPNSSAVSISQSSKAILKDLNHILIETGLAFNIHCKRREDHEWFVLETKSHKQIRKFQEEFRHRYFNKKENLRKLIKTF